MRRDSLKIFRAKCCTHGSWAFVMLGLVNGKILKRRCLAILGKLSLLQECNLINCKIFADKFRSLSRLQRPRPVVEKEPIPEQSPASNPCHPEDCAAV